MNSAMLKRVLRSVGLVVIIRRQILLTRLSEDFSRIGGVHGVAPRSFDMTVSKILDFRF